MTRDEILDEIERLSTEPASGIPSLATIAESMARVVELSGEYDEAAYDRGLITEAVVSALGRFAEMIAAYVL